VSQLPKLNVVGSIPITRSILAPASARNSFHVRRDRGARESRRERARTPVVLQLARLDGLHSRRSSADQPNGFPPPATEAEALLISQPLFGSTVSTAIPGAEKGGRRAFEVYSRS
jgi:hypothetical protein